MQTDQELPTQNNTGLKHKNRSTNAKKSAEQGQSSVGEGTETREIINLFGHKRYCVAKHFTPVQHPNRAQSWVFREWDIRCDTDGHWFMRCNARQTRQTKRKQTNQ